MSLHNSELENQLLDFSKLETDQEDLWRALDLGTNLKPSEAGSNLRGGATECAQFSPEAEGRRRKRSKRCLPRRGQANKSARGMPWHQEPMKDVISCEKLRGAANKR